jgi:rhamnulokinase
VTSLIQDKRALVAIDLGAESCRVSLLRWHHEEGDAALRPEIQLIHRLPNGPIFNAEEGPNGTLRWPLDRILAGLSEGLLRAAQAAPEGIRSIAVDGWAVDYVRLNRDGSAIEQPYCYRDVRTDASKPVVESLISPDDQFAQTGAQPLRINTVYQLTADKQAGSDPATPWLLLPEYVLSWLGARCVAEYTNATHTGLVSIETQDWSPTLFQKLGLSIEAAPPIVPSGTVIGKLIGPLAQLAAFADTDLIAPACHDTASAIAAVTADLSHTAYIVSGTWSLIGTIIDQPITSLEAMKDGFTNQGEAAGGYCFHTNVNGMWIFKQCLDHWAGIGRMVDMASLITAAAQIKAIPGIINVDAPALLLAGRMPQRINDELTAEGKPTIPDEPGNEAIFARLIFASLASRYATVISNLAALTGRSFQQITILGGGSRNELLSTLTEQSTGLPVSAGEAEGSTLGNFAVQLAAHENPGQPLTPDRVRAWAEILQQSPHPTG